MTMPRRFGMKWTTLVVALVFSIGGLVSLPTIAFARSIGAWAGHPIEGGPSNTTVTTRSCFREDAGAVRADQGDVSGADACSNPFPQFMRWEVNLPIDSTTDPKTVTFSILGTEVTTPSCTALAVNNTAGIVSFSNTLDNNTTSWVSRTLSAITVPSGGNLFLACSGLRNGTKVGTVTWNP